MQREAASQKFFVCYNRLRGANYDEWSIMVPGTEPRKIPCVLHITKFYIFNFHAGLWEGGECVSMNSHDPTSKVKTTNSSNKSPGPTLVVLQPTPLQVKNAVNSSKETFSSIYKQTNIIFQSLYSVSVLIRGRDFLQLTLRWRGFVPFYLINFRHGAFGCKVCPMSENFQTSSGNRDKMCDLRSRP